MTQYLLYSLEVCRSLKKKGYSMSISIVLSEEKGLRGKQKGIIGEAITYLLIAMQEEHVHYLEWFFSQDTNMLEEVFLKDTRVKGLEETLQPQLKDQECKNLIFNTREELLLFQVALFYYSRYKLDLEKEIDRGRAFSAFELFEEAGKCLNFLHCNKLTFDTYVVEQLFGDTKE